MARLPMCATPISIMSKLGPSLSNSHLAEKTALQAAVEIRRIGLLMVAHSYTITRLVNA